MKRISLISNSSIQYYKFSIEINLDFGRDSKLFFHQPFDSNALSYIYDPVYKAILNGDEHYWSRRELIDNDLLADETKRLKENANLEGITEIPEREIYSVNSLKRALSKFQKSWIPIPYFKNNQINKNLSYPTDWVRVYIDCNEGFSKADIVFAIDTSLAKSETDQTSPRLSLNQDENIYTLNTDENLISDFLHAQNTLTKWIEDYIADAFYGKNEDSRFEQPIKQYIGFYLLLIKWLGSLSNTPELQLYPNEGKKIPVDLVIDIGNSATCALLFENPKESGFNFDKVKKLIIQDYSNPQKQYEKPFPMNLIFKKAEFGNTENENYHNNKFVTPSLVRIGYEAEEAINHLSINLNLGREIKCFNSSPKRYLWDDSPSEVEWEFAPDHEGKVKKVNLNGISEQLKSDGSLINKGDVFGSRALYSRASLMKFVFLEIFTHAYIQINSFNFREEHGNLTIPRTISRVTISCPTAMIQYEQIALRKAAEDACAMLNNYFALYFKTSTNEKSWFDIPEIIPQIDDIKKDLSRLEERKDWTYDEATSCQLVFLYSHMAKKLKGNQFVISNYFFKKRSNITIGSVDIGAGTTDIMIAEYPVKFQNQIPVLKPNPLYWDSFKLAGDELLKELIHKIIIQGRIENSLDDGCSGVIQNYGLSKGITDISGKINGFFGEDSNKIGFKGKLMRKAFIQQVAIPIILHYLDNANKKETEIKTFEEIIGSEFKNVELIKYFEKHFGFSFLEMKWNIQSKKVEHIVNGVFDGLVRQLALIINHYKCDYVILSGKPSGLNSIENLFLKYLKVSGANLINLNNYWIGKWFPFSDSKGFVEDSKSMVAVGSIISLMSSRVKKIEDMIFDSEEIKQKLISTADYIIKKDFNSKQVILNPKLNESEFKVSNLPFSFGYSKFNLKNYPISDLYTISIDYKEILKTYNGDEQAALKKRAQIEQNMPVTISIIRDVEVSKEILKVESVEDNEGNSISSRFFKLKYKTIGDQHEYWLDSCEFILAI